MANTTSGAAHLLPGTTVRTHCDRPHLGTVLTAQGDGWYEVLTDDGMRHWWPADALTAAPKARRKVRALIAKGSV